MYILGCDEGIGIVLPDNLNRAFLILPVDDDANDSDLALHAGGLDGGHPIAVRSQGSGQHRRKGVKPEVGTGVVGMALLLADFPWACVQWSSMGLRLFEVPICRRSAIHLIGSVVSVLTRAAPASLPGSFFRRETNSVSFQPRRDISSQMMRLEIGRAHV